MDEADSTFQIAAGRAKDADGSMRRLAHLGHPMLGPVITTSATPERERQMRKLIESSLVSLDGVIGAPERWASLDAEATPLALEQLGNYDAFVRCFCLFPAVRNPTRALIARR